MTVEEVFVLKFNLIDKFYSVFHVFKKAPLGRL